MGVDCFTLARFFFKNLWPTDLPAVPRELGRHVALLPLHEPARSAGFQPAVSPTSSRQVFVSSGALGLEGVSQVGNLRYGRLEVCATPPRFMAPLRLQSWRSILPKLLRHGGGRGPSSVKRPIADPGEDFLPVAAVIAPLSVERTAAKTAGRPWFSTEWEPPAASSRLQFQPAFRFNGRSRSSILRPVEKQAPMSCSAWRL
jgi:hypothetical protein